MNDQVCGQYDPTAVALRSSSARRNLTDAILPYNQILDARTSRIVIAVNTRINIHAEPIDRAPLKPETRAYCLTLKMSHDHGWRELVRQHGS